MPRNLYFDNEYYKEELVILNREYKEKFGEVPIMHCYRYQYMEMYIYYLKLAIQENNPLSYYLPPMRVFKSRA